jgi:putative transposase
MHRTLKAEATRPPAGNLAAQQVRFNRFLQEFNEERPHESLGQETPASFYEASSTKLPRKLPPIDYPGHFEVRYVSANGGIRWKCGWVSISTTLMGEYVGLEEVDEYLWDVYFSSFRLGRLDERRMRIEDQPGRWRRGNGPFKVSPMSPD